MEKTARSVGNTHYAVDFFNTKGKNIFLKSFLYGFDIYLAGFSMYSVTNLFVAALFLLTTGSNLG
jgi:hypothetical protein